MMVLIFPCILIPYRTHIIALVVGYETEICNAYPLGEILRFIECLYLKQSLNSIPSTHGHKPALEKPVMVFSVNVNGRRKNLQIVLQGHSL